MNFTDLHDDLRIYLIKFLDINMLNNYALTYKYGLESIQKYLFYRRIMNKKNKINPTIHNSLIRVNKKYLKKDCVPRKSKYFVESIIKINKIIPNPKSPEDSYKCYYLVISNPGLCGDKYYMYPEWNTFYTIDFDENDYIPYKC